MATVDTQPPAAEAGDALLEAWLEEETEKAAEEKADGRLAQDGGSPTAVPAHGQQAEVRAQVDEDEDEPTCRVCHMEAESDRPLYHPCLCRGSIKHVHQDCLLQWLTASKNTARRCELCGGSFTFAAVYAQGAPKVLSLWELAGGLQTKVLSLWPIAMQGCLLVTLWLVILPILTSAIFQMYFCASLSELRALASIVAMFNPRDLVVECLGGTVLCTSIVVISLVAINIRDTLLPPMAARPARPPPPQQQQQQGLQRGGAARVQDNMEEGGQGGHVGAAAAAAATGTDEHTGRREDAAAGVPPEQQQQQQHDDVHDEEGVGEEEEEEEEDHGGFAGVGGLGLGQPFGWMGGGGDAAEQPEDDVFEQIVDVRELIGLNAPLPVSARRWAQLACYNVAFLTLFELLPYNLGRLVWAVVRHRATAAMMMLGSSASPLPPLSSSPQYNTPTDVLLHYIRTLTEKLLLENPPVLTSATNTHLPLGALDESGLTIILDKLLVLGIGYAILLALLILMGTVHVVVATLQDPGRTLRHIMSIKRGCLWLISWVKVGLFIACDLVMIPLMVGWVMDITTVDIFGTTVNDRLTFFFDWPFVSLSAHWLCGFSFMALAGLLATELRRVLNPDVLRGILPQPGGADLLRHHPNGVDHNHNLADLLASRSFTEHLRRVLLSLLLYLPLLLVVLYLPVRFGHTLLPSLTPLRLHFMPTSALYLEMQLPLELFLFHIALPLMLERFRLRDMVRWSLEHAFANCCRLLGLGPSLLDHETLQPTTTGASSPPPPPITTPSLYRLRLVTLILMSCITLFLASTFTIHVPIRIGRRMLAHVGLPTDHDFYNIGIGLLSTWAVLWATKLAVRAIRAHLPLAGEGGGGPRAWVKRLASFMVIATKATVLGLLWLILLPVLIGLLFELVVIIPARVPLNETPFFSTYEAWALGLVFLKIWVRCSLLGVLGNDYKWKAKFERVKNNGLRRLDFLWTLREVICPLLFSVASLILTPYCVITTFDVILSRDLAEDPPVLPHNASFEEVEHTLLTIKRHGYMMFVIFKLLWLGVTYLRDSFKKLHDRIRDDQYLVGLELRNHTFDQASSSSSSSTTTTTLVAAPQPPLPPPAALEPIVVDR